MQQRTLHTNNRFAPANEAFETPDAPLSWWHLDHFGPIQTDSGSRYPWKATDAFTRYSVIGIASNNKAKSAFEFLRDKVILTFGIPDRITSDNGPEFTGRVTDKLNQLFHIDHIFTTPHNPKANAFAERTWRWAKDYIVKHTKTMKGLSNIVPPLQLAMNSTYNSSIRMSPHFATFNVNPNTDTLKKITPVSSDLKYQEQKLLELMTKRMELFQEIKAHMEMATNRSLEYANRNYKRINIIKPGQLVLLRKTNKSVKGYSDKMLPEYAPTKSGYPFVVETINPATSNCVVRDETIPEGNIGDRFTVSADNIMPLPDDELDTLPLRRPLVANKNFDADKNKSGLEFRTKPPETQLPKKQNRSDEDDTKEPSDIVSDDTSHLLQPRRSARIREKLQTTTRDGVTISHKSHVLLSMLESSIKRILKFSHNFSRENIQTYAAHLLTTTALRQYA